MQAQKSLTIYKNGIGKYIKPSINKRFADIYTYIYIYTTTIFDPHLLIILQISVMLN